MENIVGVLKGAKQATDLVYDLFFGEKRAIAAIVLHFSDLSDIYDKYNSWTLIFGDMPVRDQIRRLSLRLVAERRRTFKNKTLDEILTFHSANMNIDYDRVTSVTVKKGILSAYMEFVVDSDLKRKMNFLIGKDQLLEAINLGEKLFPTKMKAQV